MTLIDGFNYFKECEGSDWQWTEQIEHDARQLRHLLSDYGEFPNGAALESAYHLLLDIEKWKAMCMRERMVNAQQNSEESVWAAFLGAAGARSDCETILAIMSLKGFGRSVDEETGLRRAKVASSVLRFLIPDDWGVVDWRTIAMRRFLENHKGNVDLALEEGRRWKAAELREAYDLANEEVVCAEVQAYRKMRTSPPLPRAADIGIALFGLSEEIWPF